LLPALSSSFAAYFEELSVFLDSKGPKKETVRPARNRKINIDAKEFDYVY